MFGAVVRVAGFDGREQPLAVGVWTRDGAGFGQRWWYRHDRRQKSRRHASILQTTRRAPQRQCGVAGVDQRREPAEEAVGVVVGAVLVVDMRLQRLNGQSSMAVHAKAPAESAR